MSDPMGLACARQIYRRRQELAVRIASRQGRDPLLASLTAPGVAGAEVDDPETHLSHLAESLAVERPELFERYAEWAHVVLASPGAKDHRLSRTLAATRAELERRLPSAMGQIAASYLARGMDRLRTEPGEPGNCLGEVSHATTAAGAYLAALVAGDRDAAAHTVREASSVSPDGAALATDVFRIALYEIGRLWQTGKCTVAEAHHMTETTRLLMARTRSAPAAGGIRAGRVVACCVGGELHDIGIQLVADAFENDGWDAVRLGADSGPARIGAELRRQHTDVLALSVTVASNLRQLRRIVGEVREAEWLTGIRIVVGGRPFVQIPGLWRDVGADGCAADAREAVLVCREFAPETVA